jgi:hypothetical protein
LRRAKQQPVMVACFPVEGKGYGQRCGASPRSVAAALRTCVQ